MSGGEIFAAELHSPQSINCLLINTIGMNILRPILRHAVDGGTSIVPIVAAIRVQIGQLVAHTPQNIIERCNLFSRLNRCQSDTDFFDAAHTLTGDGGRTANKNGPGNTAASGILSQCWDTFVELEGLGILSSLWEQSLSSSVPEAA